MLESDHFCHARAFRVAREATATAIVSLDNQFDAQPLQRLMSGCAHDEILLDVSDYGVRSGFSRINEVQRSKPPHSDGAGAIHDPTAYPGPLVLPDDALVDPEENDPQTFQDFVDLEERHGVTEQRKTIFLVAPPRADKSVSFVQEWSKPAPGKATGAREASPTAMHEHVKGYLQAFYDGMPVKLYQPHMTFVRHGNNKSKTPDAIDVAFGDGLLLEVRTRACPDKVFPRQLNLNDLIDVLIHMLPDDAYAIMMLVDHDIWEDDEDDFTCGRAYGASRVGLVSTARYNPALDAHNKLDIQHAWPASHCLHYVNQCIADYEASYGPPAKKRAKTISKRKGIKQPTESSDRHALRESIETYRALVAQQDNADPTQMSRRWLSRVCKTASHELGHCIGMNHCCYYACLMQSTAGMLEDARQPPYLCPIDEAKLLKTTGTTAAKRDSAMVELLKQPAFSQEPMFAAFSKWLTMKAARISE